MKYSIETNESIYILVLRKRTAITVCFIATLCIFLGSFPFFTGTKVIADDFIEAYNCKQYAQMTNGYELAQLALYTHPGLDRNHNGIACDNIGYQLK